MHYLDWLPQFGPSGIADWLILAICIYEACQTWRERQSRSERSMITAAHRLRYWPWIALAVIATGLAWMPLYLVRNTPPPLTGIQGFIGGGGSLQAPLPVPSSQAQTKRMNDLKSQLKDANSKIDQIQTKLQAADKELDAARAEKKQRADQVTAFCHSGVFNQLIQTAILEGIARQEYAPYVTGQTCYTAACFKAFTDARDKLANDTAALQIFRAAVASALSLPPNEPGCAPLATY